MSEQDALILFGVLGPLVLHRDGHGVGLGGTKQRTALALLLLRRNSVVSLDRLISVLWLHDPPPSATANVRTYVSHLRQRLDPFQDRLSTRSGGYFLQLSGSELDLAQFERAHGRAEAAPRSGHAMACSSRPGPSTGCTNCSGCSRPSARGSRRRTPPTRPVGGAAR